MESNQMTPYELMIKTNHYLINDGELTDAQKANIVRQLLAARNNKRPKFYDEADKTYPLYFPPPYNNNKKFQTVIPMSPKTHILSDNAYELEILRLLCLFAPENPAVKDMVEGTFERLDGSCPGGDCCIGECFHSSLPVLRYFAVAGLHETAWIKKLVAKINKHIDNRQKCNGGAVAYYWLCLSELPYGLTEPEIIRYKDELFSRLNKSASMNSEKDKINQPVLYRVFRNCLSRIPEYAHIKDRQPYVGEKDGRLYFDAAYDLEKRIYL
jgi:hypothetical protein